METLFKNIEEMTDNNDHGGAILEMAKFMKNKKYIKILENIMAIHKLEGYMPSNLIAYREGVRKDLLAFFTVKYGQICAEKLNSCF